jgi:hypothetical protein
MLFYKLLVYSFSLCNVSTIATIRPSAIILLLFL